MAFVFSPINMEYPVDISIKVEKDDFERDSNDNFERLLVDVSVKVENESQTKEHQDWCISNLGSPGELLEPLFFKKIADPEAEQCTICCRYFSDSLDLILLKLSVCACGGCLRTGANRRAHI
ncbi:hypothetical protein MSG28_014744 [Choristoneura fumiferana]|uniref:Uncharacterized protein n=1 Tax=Choristoneura fumiferana TaxID=7141 RepID=A0ACC0JSG8_CHOFU|nr:hypothetical protein MSG28_014744 [Choristoneura fumiferana]